MPGGDLVTEVAGWTAGGTDPDQSGVDDGLGEVGVLGEEAVSGWMALAPDLAAASRILSKTR